MTPFSRLHHRLALSAALLMAVVQVPATEAVPRSSWTQVSAEPRIQGNTPISTWARGDERCFQYPKYTVSVTPITNTPIETITVRSASAQCRQINKHIKDKPVFVIKKDFEFFLGLADNVLITDTGSGPDGRILTLYAIDRQEKFLQFDDYSDEDLVLKGNKLILWRKTSYASQNNCPQYKQWTSQGLGAVIETEVVVDLTTHRVSNTSRRRCQARQSRNPEQTSLSLLRPSVVGRNQPV